MRGRTTVLWTVVTALLAALALVPAASAATPTKPIAVLGSGSDVMFHMSVALDTLYNESPGCNITVQSGTQPLDFHCIPTQGDVTTENYLHDRISDAYPIGGGAGINQLCQTGLAGVAKINFARQTSAPSGTCTGLKYMAYARDGITWETFPSVAGSATAAMNNQAGACAGSNGFCLTQSQLQGIFVNCTITNWNQVGGANKPIQIYTILGYYGTRKAFDAFLGGSSSSCPGVKQIDQTANNEVAAADLATAIVPVSVGSWTERFGGSQADGSDLGSIDGVTPVEAHIADGSFTYSRFLYNVFCGGDPSNGNKCGGAGKAPAGVTKFVGPVGWICKSTPHADDPITGVSYRTEIANTIRNYGFAPLPLGPIGGGSTKTGYCRQFNT